MRKFKESISLSGERVKTKKKKKKMRILVWTTGRLIKIVLFGISGNEKVQRKH